MRSVAQSTQLSKIFASLPRVLPQPQVSSPSGEQGAKAMRCKEASALRAVQVCLTASLQSQPCSPS